MNLHNKTLIIGLTGGIASGKTTVSNYLKTLGAHIIDTDIIAREVVSPNSPTTEKIRILLGDDYLLADGNLNRLAIKQRIFNDDAIKKEYEAIILPAIRAATIAAVQNIPDTAHYGVLVVPLLFEKGLDSYTDLTISVDIPVEEQIKRAIVRKPDDEAVIKQIIATQMSREERNRRADFIVDNFVPVEQLHAALDTLHQLFCKRAAEQHEQYSTRENDYTT